jgi:hypothetical protein
MNDGSIVDPCDLSCFSFPVVIDEIKRESIQRTIDANFSEGAKIIVLSGKNGIGKTTIMGQFVKEHRRECVTLFVDPTNQVSFIFESIVRDLYRQIFFVLNLKEPENIEDVGPSDLTAKLQLLQYKHKRDGLVLYFVVDGLGELSEDNTYVTEDILKLMPFAFDSYRFIFSSESGKIKRALGKAKYEEIQVTMLSDEEAGKLLPGVAVSDVRDMVRIFGGAPEQMVVIKRLLDSGMTPEEIMQDCNPKNEGLFEKEWSNIQPKILGHEDLISILAFSKQGLCVADLSVMAQCDEITARRIIEQITFLKLCDDSVGFFSVGIKEFCQQKMSFSKNRAISLIIDFLKNSESMQRANIAEYYETIDAYAEIIALFDRDYLSGLISQNSGVAELSKQVRIGLKASKKIMSEKDMFRFAFLKSLIHGVTVSGVKKNELECYLKEDEFSAAIELISTCEAAEEKIQLLAVFARHQKDRKGSVDDDLTAQIKDIYQRLSPEYMAVEKVIDISADLFPVFPDMAIKLINKSDSGGGGGANKSEYAFFKFSLETIRRDEKSLRSLLEETESLGNKKKEALGALALFKEGTPAEKVLQSVTAYEDSGDAIFFLRNWIKQYPESRDVSTLVDRLLSLVVETTEYYANASVYADAVSVLRYVCKSEGNLIIEKINPQLDTLKARGPTLDYVRLAFNIALFERKHGVASDRLEKLKDYVLNDIEDKSVALSALCMLPTLNDESNVIGAEFFLELDAVKKNLFYQIKSSTAEHESILKDAIVMEAEVNLDNAVNWSNDLNTKRRRDYALYAVIKKSCEVGRYQSIDKACYLIRKLNDNNLKSKAYLALLSAVVKLDKVSRSDYKKIVKTRNKIKNNPELCRINSLLVQIAKKTNDNGDRNLPEIIKSLDLAWQGVDGDWIKIDIAFKLHNDLYSTDKKIATEYKLKAIELLKNSNITCAGSASSFVSAIDLATRAFMFLCKSRLNSESDQARLELLIEKIPGSIPRIKQFCRLASALHLAGVGNSVANIVDRRIIPELNQLGASYTKEYCVAFYWAAPILYVYSKEIFDNYVEPIMSDQILCDSIYEWISQYIVRKCMLGDPYDSVKNKKGSFTYKEIYELIGLAKRFNEDSGIYFTLKKIEKFIYPMLKNGQLSEAQINSIISDIEGLINSSFENPEYIAHEGYKVCAEAILLKLKKNKQEQEWESLCRRAECIPVLSDEIYVLGSLAESIPASMSDKKRELLTRSVKKVEQLPSGIDRLGRYQFLASVGQDINRGYVKEFLKKAVVLSTNEDSEIYEEKRHALIDAAYSMDKEFAEGLSVMLDNDPARKKIIEKNISDKRREKREEEDWNECNSVKDALLDRGPSIAWDMLARMNAANYSKSKLFDVKKYLVNVAEHDEDEFYPLASFYIHLVGGSYNFGGVMDKSVRPLFHGMIEDLEFFSNFQGLGASKSFDIKGRDGAQLIIDHYDEGIAANYVKKWIEENDDYNLDIVEPYFEFSNLEFIGEVTNRDPNFNIRILTSISRMKKLELRGASDIADAASCYWRDYVSTSPMPSIELIFVGLSSLDGDMPIHDRWWLTKRGGLRFGTSLNGIGKPRLSEISKLMPEHVVNIEQSVGGFFKGSQIVYNNEKLKVLRMSVI